MIMIPKPTKKARRRPYGWNKFGAKRVKAMEGNFPSRLEYEVFKQHQFRALAGEIRDLKRYGTVLLTDANITYKPDMNYIDCKSEQRVFVEAKGMEGERWRIIKKLWAYYGPAELIVFYKKNGSLVTESIKPKGLDLLSKP